MRLTLGLFIACAGLLHVQDATGSIAGVVRDPTGLGISGALLRFGLESGGPSIEARADPNGAYRLDGLTSGTYLLQFVVPGFRFYRIKLDLLPGEELRVPRITLDIGGSCGFPASPLPDFWKLLPEGTQTGRFSGVGKLDRPPGAPAAGAQVTLCLAQGECRTSKSDSQGKFEFADLPGGEYRLRMTAGGFASSAGPTFEVKPGWEAVYSLTLSKARKPSEAKVPAAKKNLPVCE